MANHSERKDEAKGDPFSQEEKQRREIQGMQRQAEILRMIAWSALFSLLLVGLIVLL